MKKPVPLSSERVSLPESGLRIPMPVGATPPRQSAPEFSNGLDPAEAERLALLIEECGEVSQAAAKVLRFGYEGRYDDPPETNRQALEREVGDLTAVMILMDHALDLSTVTVAMAARRKRDKLKLNTHHQGGVL